MIPIASPSRISPAETGFRPLFFILLLAGCFGTARSAGVAAPPSASLDGCRITFSGSFYWRDCMPADAGSPERIGSPDGCSRLITLEKFHLDNSGGGGRKFEWKAVVVEAGGKIHVPAAVGARFEDHSSWDGEVKAGQVCDVEIITRGGPFLAVHGTLLHVETKWTDESGGTATIDSPDARIGTPL
jgi:hypothetical protein